MKKKTAQPAEVGQGMNTVNAEAEQPPAWVEIEEGRFQPLRIKGSCVGRELG